MSCRHGNKRGARGPSASLVGTKVVATEMDRLRQSEVAYKAKIRAVSPASNMGLILHTPMTLK